jgi:hypothetical protein
MCDYADEEINALGNVFPGILIITRYDYNLTIMKSPKPATDNRFKK